VRVADLVRGEDVRAEEKEKTPDFISRRWMSRAVMSLKTR
jgi:hypothetical protein